MTRQEAAYEQNRIGIIYGKENLSWWFGTDCEKCCEVFPRFRTNGSNNIKNCWYECDVCGKRTDPQVMPWVAKEAWNEHKYQEGQIRFC